MIVAVAAANHPRGTGATRLGAKVVIVVAARIISNSIAAIFFLGVWGIMVAAATANHPRGIIATGLDAKVVVAVVVGVICGSPAAFFLLDLEIYGSGSCCESPLQPQRYLSHCEFCWIVHGLLNFKMTVLIHGLSCKRPSNVGAQRLSSSDLLILS